MKGRGSEGGGRGREGEEGRRGSAPPLPDKQNNACLMLHPAQTNINARLMYSTTPNAPPLQGVRWQHMRTVKAFDTSIVGSE